MKFSHVDVGTICTRKKSVLPGGDPLIIAERCIEKSVRANRQYCFKPPVIKIRFEWTSWWFTWLTIPPFQRERAMRTAKAAIVWFGTLSEPLWLYQIMNISGFRFFLLFFWRPCKYYFSKVINYSGILEWFLLPQVGVDSSVSARSSCQRCLGGRCQDSFRALSDLLFFEDRHNVAMFKVFKDYFIFPNFLYQEDYPGLQFEDTTGESSRRTLSDTGSFPGFK